VSKTTQPNSTKHNNTTHTEGHPTGQSVDARRKMIAESAYFRAEQRGFAGGNPAEDWLTAEREMGMQAANAHESSDGGFRGN